MFFGTHLLQTKPLGSGHCTKPASEKRPKFSRECVFPFTHLVQSLYGWMAFARGGWGKASQAGFFFVFRHTVIELQPLRPGPEFISRVINVSSQYFGDSNFRSLNLE
jgi:hypothetical protein